jgi:hypothetical protein
MARRGPGAACLLASLCCALSGVGDPPASPAVDLPAIVASSDLVYVSDYFSFAGADAAGHVAFALDSNRGRRRRRLLRAPHRG